MELIATHMHAVPSYGRGELSRQLQTIPSTTTAPRATPVAALSHVLAFTHVHHAAERSVSASQMSQNRRSSADRSCSRARPRTTASIAPKLARAPEPAMLTTREKSKVTRSCGGSLQTATTSGGTTRGAQTMERPHCCPAARALPPSARAVCRLIAATAPSSFPARLKGGTSTCGSTPSDSRNVHTCGKGESSER
jgi:hypothetical protein